MVSTHNTRNLPQHLDKKIGDHTPISMSIIDKGSLKQFPNPNSESTITEPLSLSQERKELNPIED